MSIQEEFNTVKFVDIDDATNKHKLSPSEALFGFCGWLTTRKEKTIMSSTDECGCIAELVVLFCKENNLDMPVDDWAINLIHPKESDIK